MEMPYVDLQATYGLASIVRVIGNSSSLCVCVIHLVNVQTSKWGMYLGCAAIAHVS
jgi:hypothetical protein